MNKLLALIVTLIAVNCYSATKPLAAYQMAQKGEAVFIDVREEDEIKSGMIADAKWFPTSKVLNDKEWKKDFIQLTADKKIFLYCRSGQRSGKVLGILKDNGIPSENMGGYEQLSRLLPTRTSGQKSE